MLRSCLSKALLALVAIVPAQWLCAQSTFPDYPQNAASDYSISTHAADVTIGVKALDDRTEQKTYFDTELSRIGFVPVFVVIQNGSNSDSFLLDKTKLTYGTTNATATTPKTPSKAGQSMAFATIPFIGFIKAITVIKSASLVQQNVLQKELQSTTLSPGASAHGFVYIPVPKNAPRQTIHLQVPITRAGTSDTLLLDLVF